MGLDAYNDKRDFEATPEPPGDPATSDPNRLSYVIQRHAARRLHYDFRLELNGVLLSWSVPKGPSLDPAVKRLAVRTEDHPLDYGGFEGVIPKGQYGGGSVLLWDRGVWRPHGDPEAGLRKGRLTFDLDGDRLKGAWTLIRTGRPADKEQWLLRKVTDEHAIPGDVSGATERWTTSVTSGRNQTEIAEHRERVWTRAGEVPGRGEVVALEGAREGLVPWPIGPELPTLTARPVDEPGWIHELKLDGYRMLARKAAGTARLYTRSGQDWTERLRGVARALELDIPIDDAVLDGELVYLGADGRSDFPALQRSIGRDDPRLFYVAFDLLQLGDVDLREVPLLRRKDLLSKVVPPQGRIRYGAHVTGAGSDVLARACELGVEGIVSKRADAPYRSGRSRDWAKVKCHGREDFVVLGFLVYTEPLSSLVLGQEDPDGLRYVGRVGTGFSDADRKALRARLEPLTREAPPVRASDAPKGTRWVEPRLRVDVKYTGWTDAGILRHASFLGVREERVVQPVALDVRVTNAERVLYPDVGVTKGQVAAYYARFADLVLGQVARRPLTLLRCPTGLDSCFHQKHLHHLPPSVRPVEVGEEQAYVYVEDAEGLLALIQNGALELHPWGSTIDRLEQPDRIVMDLDPDEDLPRETVVHAAWELRALLEELGLVSFPKLTGGKGLHVVVPITPRLEWPAIKAFTKALAEEITRRAPARYTAVITKKRRVGKIFVDYLRNQRDATAVAAWSTRARPGARVAVPITWRELDPEAPADAPRLDRIALPTVDPWGDLAQIDQTVTPEMMKRLQPRT